ncbi:Asp/Glu/Hydantoin racemase [Aquimixticola soesokkakensis]|uniref:Asp/Glu/Hydantoin racemase n=1 Tax=Aquimixticola soesokkakensis TaxID=1519096 RepID=A0A1Y5T5N1_9RHOB|nr:aspartate/glutamate racemase family protein [Aquimixticola soesokkakensis]SLN55975.1 Asp/Glu/Hydantoin racemase [Aquimixticola soesokkakensis]
MRLVYVNPNATQAMTDGIVAAARRAAPQAQISGRTNRAAPPAIQGPEDGESALPGLLGEVTAAANDGADAIVIACFDDTGLAQARAAVTCPVLGIGQAAYTMASLLGLRFCVVTSLPVSVPVIAQNIADSGFAGLCEGVRASGLPVLEIDAGSPRTRAHLARAISEAARDAGAVILGCAGMSPLAEDLRARTGVTLIDGVAASARLAMATVQPA